VDQSQAVFQLIGNCGLVWGALVGTASVIVHARVFVRSSRMSVHLLVYMAAIAIVFDLGIVKLVIGDSWGFQLIRLVAFFSVPLVMTHRLWLQICAQRDGHGTGEPPPVDRPDTPGHPAG
jgi:hypothetical protein